MVEGNTLSYMYVVIHIHIDTHTHARARTHTTQTLHTQKHTKLLLLTICPPLYVSVRSHTAAIAAAVYAQVNRHIDTHTTGLTQRYRHTQTQTHTRTKDTDTQINTTDTDRHTHTHTHHRHRQTYTHPPTHTLRVNSNPNPLTRTLCPPLYFSVRSHALSTQTHAAAAADHSSGKTAGAIRRRTRRQTSRAISQGRGRMSEPSS